MSSLAKIGIADELRVVSNDERQDYVPLILRSMDEQDIGIRKLAVRTRIGKTRLGQVLHRDPAKRTAMTLVEFQSILQALNINIIQAIISVETIKDQQLLHSARYATLISMLCEMFHDLPANLIAALEEVEDIDGSEVRHEWAGVLRQAVVKRLVHEISAAAKRRSLFGEMSILNPV